MYSSRVHPNGLYTTTIFGDEQKPTTTKQLLSAKLEHKTQEYIQLVPCARMQLEFENPLLLSTLMEEGEQEDIPNMFNQGPFQNAISVPPFFIHIALGIYKTKIGANK
jgi:hypothetical protein